MSVLMFIVAVLLSYIIGSFPTSFIIAKFLKGIDIRQVGSKNAGATNVLRSVGKLPAIVTLVVDILKGLLVVTILYQFFYQFEQDLVPEFFRAILGLTVVAGHIWSVFLKFKGGKGVATTIGVALGIAPHILLPTIVIWLVVFFITNYVSLASILSLLAFPIIAVIFNTEFYTTILSVTICAIVIYKHKDNIKRLLKREESKTIIFKGHS